MIAELNVTQWHGPFDTKVQSQAITALENGKILLLTQLPFELLAKENQLLDPALVGTKSKNISYTASTALIQGHQAKPEQQTNLATMMARYARNAHGLIQQLFPSYTRSLQMGRTSFRPVEIAHRPVKSYRKDDTRLHIDAFPANPNQGRRILRVFTNVNPHGQERLWRVGESFETVAKQFLPKVRPPWPGRSWLLNKLNITKSWCTDYDYFMLQIHDQMKADLKYQKAASQAQVCFAPGSTWIVQTDEVSHAAMAGQHVFEQTFYLPVQAMANPQNSPLKMLEKLAGRALV